MAPARREAGRKGSGKGGSRVSTGLGRGAYNRCMGTRGFDRSVLEWIAGRGVIALVKPVAVIN